jgi:cytochrome b
MESKHKKTNPVKVNFLVDLAIFVAFLAALDPHSTGLTIHEWLGVAFGVAIVVHLLLHWQWLVATTRRFFGRLPLRARINYLLNGLLFIAMTLMIFSGLLISEEALPVLGINLQVDRAWRSLHALAADAILIIVGLHLALHWKWIVTTTKRYVLAPVLAGRPRVAPASPATKPEEVTI